MKNILLKNSRGEEFFLHIEIAHETNGPKGSVGRHRVVVTFSAEESMEIESGTRAIYGDGSPLNNWEQPNDLTVRLTSGDIKRLGTYPLWIIRSGDRTRRGRYGWMGQGLVD